MNMLFLLKDKIRKTILIVNKFNITINFFNIRDILKGVLYLKTDIIY
jgi:hypothetical protein